VLGVTDNKGRPKGSQQGRNEKNDGNGSARGPGLSKDYTMEKRQPHRFEEFRSALTEGFFQKGRGMLPGAGGRGDSKTMSGLRTTENEDVQTSPGLIFGGKGEGRTIEIWTTLKDLRVIAACATLL